MGALSCCHDWLQKRGIPVTATATAAASIVIAISTAPAMGAAGWVPLGSCFHDVLQHERYGPASTTAAASFRGGKRRL
jgi:hypothetical protein